MLLNSLNDITLGDDSLLFKTNGLDQLKIIPINIALLGLLLFDLLLSFRLLLFGQMIVIDSFTFFEDGLFGIYIGLQSSHIFLVKGKDVGIRFSDFVKVLVKFGSRP